MGILTGGFSLMGFNLFACPSGQTCPVAESLCIADPTLCVAESSSTDSATSSEPTTVQEQLGITLDPDNNTLVRVFHFDSSTKTWSFYDPKPEFSGVNTLTQIVQGEPYWIRVTQEATMQSDANAAPVPLLEGWNLIVR